MKTLGIIGGIAPASTIEYYRMLIATYQQRRPDGSNPPVIINSIDMQTMLRLIAADALDDVTAYLSAEIDKLVRAGADVALLASNTPHVVFSALQSRSRIPLISIVEATFDVAKALNLKRVGLLGTRFTMQSAAYPSVFTRRGITVVVPDASDQEYVHGKYMSELVRAEYLPETRAGLLAVVERLRSLERIDGVILGGTELPLILRDVADAAIPFLDTGKFTWKPRWIGCWRRLRLVVPVSFLLRPRARDRRARQRHGRRARNAPQRILACPYLVECERE